MELTFDIRGNLKPYHKIGLTLNEFKKNFVDSFEEYSTRHEIFSNFEQYCQEFKKDIAPNFKQLINGSFVTNRINPNDIDLVNLIDYETALKKYDLLREKFLNRQAMSRFKIDAYLVRIYPKDHKEYSKTVSDLLYWEHWFGNTRKNRAKKRFPKGFIELSF